MSEKQHTLFVCTTRASVWKDDKRVGTSAGQNKYQLADEIVSTYSFSKEA